MMTIREAHQRAEVYGLYIAHTTQVHHKGLRMYAAASPEWSLAELREQANWREDIEDAVMDCARIGGSNAKVSRRNSRYLVQPAG